MSIFQKEDLLTVAQLRDILSKDPNYGVYIVNIARIKNNKEEYSDVNVTNPNPDTFIEGAININIGTIKEPHLINIPPTWIPISLADYGEPTDIFKAPGFKTMVEAGWMALITKEAYERIMEDEDAKEARAHLLNEKFNVNASYSNDDQLLKHMNSTATKKAGKSAKKVTKAASLSLIVSEFTDKTSEVAHNTLFQKFNAVAPKLTQNDLEHLAQHAIVPKIKTAAEKRLKALQE